MEKAFKLKSTVYLNEHYALFYWVIMCKKTVGWKLMPTVQKIIILDVNQNSDIGYLIIV